MVTRRQAPADGSTSVRGLTLPELRSWIGRLAHLDDEVTDAERVDQLRLLEELKAAAAGAQARVAAAFDASQRAEQAAAGVPPSRQGTGIAAQVALARRESPHRGGRHLGLATVLVREMPHTLRAMEGGRLSEWRATLLARETACLDRELRALVDERLCSDVDALEQLGDRQLVAEARRIAYRHDPRSTVDRFAHAADERRVTLRPAPDTMCYLTAMLPVAEGVAAYAALARRASAAKIEGDQRGIGQLMADTLVERVTGQADASDVPVAIGLVMSDRTLLAGGDEPGELEGYGPVPAEVARHLVAAAPPDRRWLRRLYSCPTSGALISTDSRARRFPDSLARLVKQRDRRCRTPWCNAPIRETDHVVDHAAGGPTSLGNAQGLCQACNHHKQALGWRASVTDDDLTITTTTPTGHTYRSGVPPPAGTPPAVGTVA